jgi:PQQ-dependent catabolism-associated CXXCW motif protein
MRTSVFAAGVLVVSLLGSATYAAETDAGIDVPEPPGYRTEPYRAPVPQTLHGAQVVTTDDAAAIWRRGTAAFIDVLPQPRRPPNLPAGTVWRDTPRLDIPGSLWLPDTGYGDLAPVTETYFAAGLTRASGGDRGKPLVFYCQKNCWMSWNAAKRALALGYTNVTWFPDGTDGWQAAGLPLADAKPEPRPE